MMQTEILIEMRINKDLIANAKKALDAMSSSLIGSITDSIQEYNELYETNYVLSMNDVVKQPEKRKPGRPKGQSLAGNNRDKLIEFLRINGPSYRSFIVEGTKIPDGSFNYTVKRAGSITKLPDGRYSLNAGQTDAINSGLTDRDLPAEEFEKFIYSSPVSQKVKTPKKLANPNLTREHGGSEEDRFSFEGLDL